MALLKLDNNKKNKIVKIIAGALLIINAALTYGYVKTNIELSKEKENSQTLAKNTRKIKLNNELLQEELSIQINSESDIRVIREDLIEKIKKTVQDRNYNVETVDVLRALNSAENRIMEEYIRVAALILATMETETGFTHMIYENTNGTFDYGIMQVNEVVIPHLREALGEHLDPIHNRDHNVEGGSWEIHECYLKAKDKHPEDVIWWTYAYYNRGLYFEGTDAWKNPNNPNYKKVHKQANTRSNIFKKNFEAYYNALMAEI